MDNYTEILTNQNFDFLQIGEIKKGIREGINVSLYANPEYSGYTMRQLRKGLEQGIDMTPYVGYDVGIMCEIRKSIPEGVDIIHYVEDGYDMEQLRQIRHALAAHLDIDKYLNPEYYGSAIREIVLGLRYGLDVDEYAKLTYSWRKMRELRLGLQHRVDVSKYNNPYYSCWQMREIRLGLEAGLDVESYKSLMYTAKAMRKKRLELEKQFGNAADTSEWKCVSFEFGKLYISGDQLQAEQLKKDNDNMVAVLGTLVEHRDLESGEHINRVKAYTEIMANELMKQFPEYNLTEHDIKVIVAASPLHDIGKIVIPDKILFKPGKLNSEEFDYMKSHTLSGCEMIESIKDTWSEEYKRVGMEISHYHHERYDGSGYPEGLVGDEIPISAQLVSVADVYDALVHERVYKNAYPKDRAFRMIINGECGTFSPQLLECLRNCRERMEAV